MVIVIVIVWAGYWLSTWGISPECFGRDGHALYEEAQYVYTYATLVYGIGLVGRVNFTFL